MAEETGGIAAVNTNDFSDMFARIVQDTSSYYLLGYSPDPGHADGRLHPIRVRVNRPDVAVRARRGYYAPSPEAPPAKPLPPLPEDVSVAARKALQRPVATPGLEIEVSTASFKGTDRESSIAIGIAR